MKENLPATETKFRPLAVLFNVFSLGIQTTCILTLLCCY